jgi:hypothetical protein
MDGSVAFEGDHDGSLLGASSPDPLRGVVRNLPACIAGAALHPPVARGQALLDLQDDQEESGIGCVPVFANVTRAAGFDGGIYPVATIHAGLVGGLS